MASRIAKIEKCLLLFTANTKYFDSTVQRAEDRRKKFYFCRLPFAVNVNLNLSNLKKLKKIGYQSRPRHDDVDL